MGKQEAQDCGMLVWFDFCCCSLSTLVLFFSRSNEGVSNILPLLRCSSTCGNITKFFDLFRFLAMGDSYKSIGFSYRIGQPTVSLIVAETCEAIWEALQPTYLKSPTREDWREIADGFERRWNFPNCIGALDSKHVVIQAPPRSGSLYFNYKGTFSRVLMALVDHRYCFTVIDVGSYGRNSDGGIYANSALGRALERGELGVPEDKLLPNAAELGPMPHVIVGDEAFPLKTYLMRPYPGKNLTDKQRVFNYRLSRARRIVENAFGILTARFRIYQRRVQLHPDNAEKMIRATLALHNYLQKTAATPKECAAGETTNTGQAETMQNLRLGGNRASNQATKVRGQFKECFVSAGCVDWQRSACLSFQSN